MNTTTTVGQISKSENDGLSFQYYLNIFMSKIYLQTGVIIGIITNVVILIVCFASKHFKDENSVKVRVYYIAFAIADLMIIFFYFFFGALGMIF